MTIELFTQCTTEWQKNERKTLFLSRKWKRKTGASQTRRNKNECQMEKCDVERKILDFKRGFECAKMLMPHVFDTYYYHHTWWWCFNDIQKENKQHSIACASFFGYSVDLFVCFLLIIHLEIWCQTMIMSYCIYCHVYRWIMHNQHLVKNNMQIISKWITIYIWRSFFYFSFNETIFCALYLLHNENLF